MFKTPITRLLMAVWVLAWSGAALAAEPPMAGMAAETTAEKPVPSSTADHSKFKELQGPFKTGPDVTKACLSCHTEAAKQLHKTKHWTWDYINTQTNQHLGKNKVINNFCTAVPSNYKFCTACHIGYGWENDKFDFTSEVNVDCLVCHDTTGKYKKLPGLAGHPNYDTMEFPAHSGKFRPPTDLKAIAQGVGKTSRQTCGACHFRGGGGDAVKHGDLDSSLEFPKKYLDVHMDANGLNFSCSKCHVTESHEVSGSRNQMTAADDKGFLVPGSTEKRNPATCVACHSNDPHDSKHAVLNRHTEKLACQTCHIPAYARAQATKMTWDWSTSGKLDAEGHRIVTKGSDGNDIYDSKKGDFTWEKYVIPEYQWFNGEVIWTLPDTKFDPNQVLKINAFQGSAEDGKSRIWPTKVFRGKQAFDKASNTLVVASLADDPATGFWMNYDMKKAVTAGQAYVGKEFSGDLGFVATEMSWPITHMVAPKDDALKCDQCHRENGRLAGITGIYMPATGQYPLIDKLGFGIAFLTLLGVLGHGAIRFYMHKRGK
jgi:octaheme c-type cytochrome (tetrathionate reductase family)